MDTLVNSIVGIHVAQKELGKYPTEQEQKKAMEMIHSRAITSSCYNVFYFIVAFISAGLIHWALQ
jgi:hypothetical protein